MRKSEMFHPVRPERSRRAAKSKDGILAHSGDRAHSARYYRVYTKTVHIDFWVPLAAVSASARRWARAGKLPVAPQIEFNAQF